MSSNSFQRYTALSASGTAIVVNGSSRRGGQVVITPDGATGTATITVKMVGSDDWETAFDESGDALAGLSLASTFTKVLDDQSAFGEVRVVSTNSSDDFTVTLAV